MWVESVGKGAILQYIAGNNQEAQYTSGVHDTLGKNVLILGDILFIEGLLWAEMIATSAEIMVITVHYCRGK